MFEVDERGGSGGRGGGGGSGSGAGVRGEMPPVYGGASSSGGSGGGIAQGGSFGIGGRATGGQPDTAGAGGAAGMPTRVTMIAIGSGHSCALLSTGQVRCWGRNQYGQLGYGHTESIGDDEFPRAAGDVEVGDSVTQIACGGDHTCALVTGGRVRCWGYNGAGELGYVNTNQIGDDEAPASAGDVDVGGYVVQLALGGGHSCALLAGGTVRCWGWNQWGQLGYGHTYNIGDFQSPAAAGDVDVGAPVVQISASGNNTCALLAGGEVRCWGDGLSGQLGHMNTDNVGDDETPASAGSIPLGGLVTQIAGGPHPCALFSAGNVRCWGYGTYGELGYATTDYLGDDEPPASRGDVQIGGTAIQVASGYSRNCALLSSKDAICWGYGLTGALGYGNQVNIGDHEVPATFGPLNIGGPVESIATSPQSYFGEEHTCALMSAGTVRCWGAGFDGRLGYGNTNIIGDDEVPAVAGDVPVF